MRSGALSTDERPNDFKMFHLQRWGTSSQKETYFEGSLESAVWPNRKLENELGKSF